MAKVALDESGRPSFNLLQNQGSAPIIYYVFDVLILAGREVMAEPLTARRDLLRSDILPKLAEPIRHCPELNASLADVIQSVRAAGLEGVVAKRLDSAYEPGSRSGVWRKMRINQAQEFVIGGYTFGGKEHKQTVIGTPANVTAVCEGDTLLLEIKRQAGPGILLHTKRRMRLVGEGQRLESHTTQSPPPIAEREEVFDRQ